MAGVSGPWIETVGGRKFYYLHPEFNVADIAWSLGNTVRFGGHVSRYYSVAEHSIIVSEIMEDLFPDSNPLEGLLHDATEAYLCDLPSPAKGLLPDYKRLERSIDKAMRQIYGLPLEKSKECHLADQAAYHLESKELMPNCGVNHPVDERVLDLVSNLSWENLAVVGIEMPDISWVFVDRFDELSAK